MTMTTTMTTTAMLNSERNSEYLLGAVWAFWSLLSIPISVTRFWEISPLMQHFNFLANSWVTIFLNKFRLFSIFFSQFTWQNWNTNNSIKYNHEESIDGSKKEFVVTETQTHGPGHGTVYKCSEPSVILLSYPGAPFLSNYYVIGKIVNLLWKIFYIFFTKLRCSKWPNI